MSGETDAVADDRKDDEEHECPDHTTGEFTNRKHQVRCGRTDDPQRDHAHQARRCTAP